MKHTKNGIVHHRNTTGCEGIMHKSISDKGDLGAFEVYACDGIAMKGRNAGKPCGYYGRGAQVRVGPAEQPEIETEIEGIIYQEDDELPESEDEQ